MGIIYWVASPVANLIFPESMFTTDQFEVITQINSDATMAALCVFANILTPYTQALIYVHESKLTTAARWVIIAIDWLLTLSCFCLYYLDSNSYLYLNYYYMYEVGIGATNAIFYVVLAVKFAKLARETGCMEIPMPVPEVDMGPGPNSGR